VRTLVVVLAALVACRGGDTRSAPVTKAPLGDTHAGSYTGSGGWHAPPATGSADQWAGSTDPWATPPSADDPDDPPSLAERHRLAEQACPVVKAPYFYRIEKAGKVSHILGTRHISVPLAKFPHTVTDALSTAKLAVFEVAPDDHGTVETKKQSLPDVLGPALWKHYREIVGSTTADALAQAKPSEAAIMMIAMYEDISAMLDMEIQRQVLAAHIPTAGLESSAFQDELLDKLMDARMLKAEVSATKNRQELADESKKDLSEYCAGQSDKPGMDEDTRKDMLAAGYTQAELDAMDEQLVYARNASWIPKLEKMFADGDVFVAVGADHLRGPRGVVALLAKRGFTVKRE